MPPTAEREWPLLPPTSPRPPAPPLGRRSSGSLVGAATGVIAGLATVTPASGFVGPAGGLILGAVAGVVCFFAVDVVKERLKVDDSLDVFAVHGIGGAIGVLLVSFLAATALQGGGVVVESGSMLEQLGVQALALAAVAGWAAGFTFIIVKASSLIIGGIRVDEQAELEGLDLTAHGERGYDL